MISLSPIPVKRPFEDEDSDVSINDQGEQLHKTDISGWKRLRTCHFGDNGSMDNTACHQMNLSSASLLGRNFQFSSPSSSCTFNSSAGLPADLANEENQSPMKTNTNRFIFTDSNMKDKRRRMDESLDRLREYGIPALNSGNDNIDCNRVNKEIYNNRNHNGDIKCDASDNFVMPMNPVHMQTMYEAQLANMKKEIAEKNAEIQALHVKNNALFEDSKILKKAVNIQESRQKEMASYNQQLESTLGQAVEHITGLEKVVQSLKSQLYGAMVYGPSHHLDEPPPDVY